MTINKVSSGIMEVDIHGKNKYQAKICLDSYLKKAGSGIYRIRVIHGYHSGTELKDMLQQEYSKHQRIIRIEHGLNEGITDLILREL